MTGRVLLVDDDAELCRLLEADLGRRGFDLAWTTTADAALERLAREDVDVVLTDLRLPGSDGLELCRGVSRRREDVPVLVMTAFGSLESAIGAIRAGAWDFVTKPVDPDLLTHSLERAIEHRALRRKIRVLSERLERTDDWGELLGESPAIRDLRSQLDQIAATDASVLIRGESGTGKELIARALHARSARKDGPFVPVNCAALPEALLESELFGHRRGAFTGARADRKGLLLQADGGTLFLDEVGDLPPATQPKLLRALESRAVRPVGGDTERPFDARIVAATNRDLEAALDDGSFRDDLYYRINVIQVHIPPLRERDTDTLLLARHFVARCAERSGKEVGGLAASAEAQLLDYPWPGNVRELANAMDRAVALTRYDTVGVEDLPPHVRDHRPPVPYGAGDAAALVSLREMERRHIRRVLAAVGGNRSRAARILGLDRKTLYRKLRDDPKDAALPAGRATRPPPDSARGGGRTAPRRAHSRTRDPGGR